MRDVPDPGAQTVREVDKSSARNEAEDEHSGMEPQSDSLDQVPD